MNGLPGLNQAPTGSQDGERLVLLGTQGGPFIRSYKQTPSANLIVYKNIPMVIDTGFGVTFKLLEAGIKLASLNYIFITHHHSDHNLELGPLLYNAWRADYLIYELMYGYGPAVEEMVKRRPNATRLKASILSHHTLAEDVGKIAQAANAKNLILNYFVPPDDKSLTDEVWVKAVRTTFSGKIIVGKDLLQVAL